ncbi:MAG: FumA C-terminus/TtdB family hydratase beta subunit [Acutalibacteraceae bacterium]
MNYSSDFKKITLPFDRKTLDGLNAGDYLLLSGTLYTGRDAAHKRLCETISRGDALPVDFKGQAIYYVGPCFDENGKPTGAGPTTSMRMDAYAPALYDYGVCASIGKGNRAEKVYDAIKRCGGVYLCAIGGAGALYAKAIENWKKVTYEDLGTEAVHEMQVKDFPVIVGIDSRGNSVFPD